MLFEVFNEKYSVHTNDGVTSSHPVILNPINDGVTSSHPVILNPINDGVTSSHPVIGIEEPSYSIAAEPTTPYGTPTLKKQLSAALILDKVGSKDSRKTEIDDFKGGKIDFLFVYNMLLTGFDAKRLKKLYIGRIVKDHNLLQTLTRVNRPYKNFQYGFVVDFADITKSPKNLMRRTKLISMNCKRN